MLTETPPAPAPSAPAPPRRRARAWLALLVVLAGVLVLLYPVAASQFNNVKQREFAEKYSQQTASLEPSTLKAALDRAHQYNAQLSGVPILDPWLTQAAGSPSDAYADYASQLNDFDAMARLRVPVIGVDLPVRHGTSDKVLATGVGHLYGTALPVGGAGTHTVLTSHTGLPDATLFDRLVDVKLGDQIYVEVYGETLAYQVDRIDIVLPEQTDKLLPVADEDLLTLVTCTPYAVNTHRLLVRGHRVPFDAATADLAADAPRLVLQPWMYGLIGLALACLLVTALIVLISRRRNRRHTAA